MKKIIFVLQLCVLVGVSSFAQIVVSNTDMVGIGLSSGIMPLSPLTVGGTGDASALVSISSSKTYSLLINGGGPSGGYGIHSTVSNFSSQSVALQGIGGPTASHYPGTGIGVRGIGRQDGFGVSGLIDGTNGAGIYGGVGSTETSVTGLYAGYFNGNVVVNGGGSSGGYGIHSTAVNHSGEGVALQGIEGSTGPSSSGTGIGARGIALKKGFGVSGLIDGTNGAGIYGGTGNTEAAITGLYAGYFNGNVVVNGTINGVDISNSDIRYKKEILGLDSEKSLKSILMMRPVEYRLKQQYTEYKKDDVIEQRPVYDEKSEIFQKKHYGLIAQELQELYPDLIYETNAEGYLGINYTEIIPMLIQSVQELHKQTEIIPVLIQSIQDLNKKIELLENRGSVLESDTDATEKELDMKQICLTK